MQHKQREGAGTPLSRSSEPIPHTHGGAEQGVGGEGSARSRDSPLPQRAPFPLALPSLCLHSPALQDRRNQLPSVLRPSVQHPPPLPPPL